MPRLDYALIIPTADDPDMVVSNFGDATWDRFTELCEIEHRELMLRDPTYRRLIADARRQWAREASTN